MSPYCTEDQVRAICDTDVTDAEITELIEEADWLIDQRITGGSISVIGYRKLSRLMTAVACMLKDPNSLAIGEYREDRGMALKFLRDEIALLFRIAQGGAGFTVTIAPIE